MNGKLKKLAVTLTITAILFSLSLANMKIAFSIDTGGKIDLFTQKEPYSGKGPNKPSDAFGPGDEVQIYALATYNELPLQNLLVAFEILGPKNPVENITFYRATSTNETGIATMSFRISHLNKTTFGEWTAIGNTKIGDLTFQDSVMFKVGWVVEIVSIKTMNENYMDQENFTRGSYVGVELVLRNIAMTEKIATLTLTIYDCLNFYVNSTELRDFVLQPNGTPVTAYFFLYIPKGTHVGSAAVYACAYTTSVVFHGIPYCPEVSKHFLIIAGRYFLEVRTEPVGIVPIPGEGWYEEYANVSLAAPDFVSFSSSVGYKFSCWDVDGVSQGAGVSSINVLMDTNHTAAAHYTQIIMYALTITSTAGGATIPAPGTYNYAADSTVQVKAVPAANHIFDHWELDSVGVGSANPYPVYMDTDHTLKAVFSPAPAGWFVPDWFYLFLLPILILTIIVLIMWFYRRKRREKAEEAFYSGWTAWYYCQDLRNRIRRN